MNPVRIVINGTSLVDDPQEAIEEALKDIVDIAEIEVEEV